VVAVGVTEGGYIGLSSSGILAKRFAAGSTGLDKSDDAVEETFDGGTYAS